MKSSSYHNPAYPVATLENLEIGSEVAQLNRTAPPLKSKVEPPKAKRTLSRTHTDCWKGRLFRRTYDQDGQLREMNDLHVRLQDGGRREFFGLNSTNQDAAAVKARDIFTFLKANGWRPRLRSLNPMQTATPSWM